MNKIHLVILALLSYPMLLAAQAPRDSVIFTPTGDCCFSVTVLNRNPNKTPIDDFHIVVLSSGTTISASPAPPSAPADWTVASLQTDTVSFVGSPGTPFGIIRAGMDHGPFTVCFNNASSIISIRWITTSNGQEVTAVTTELQCAVTCDEVTPIPTGDCCYTWNVFNLNSQQLDIDDFHLAITTPGAVFTSQAAPPGWTVTAPTTSTLTYTLNVPGTPIQPHHELNGFVSCVSPPPTGGNQVVVRWRTTHGGVTICSGTDTLICEPQQQRCDSVEVSSSPDGDCCYDVTLVNLHTPAGPLNDFHMKVLTPGASFAAGSASGPWSVASQTSTDITWQLAGALMPSGSSQGGFHFCVQPGATSPTVTLLWESTLNGQVICSDTLSVACQPASSCDTVRVKAKEGCCFNFGVLNRHTPQGLINDFHIEVATPGVHILPTPQFPAGWSIGSLSNDKAEFTTANNPILPSAFLSGFVLCFDSIPASGVFLVKWKTTLDRKTICEDSLWLRCDEDPPVCDSVDVIRSLDSCCYDVRIRNSHYPPSPLTDLHFRILTPGVQFTQTPIGPAGWNITSATSTAASFLTQTSPLLPGGSLSGFMLCFTQSPNVTGSFAVVWESTFDGRIICSDTLHFTCHPVQPPCDEVTVENRPGDCCFDFLVANRHNGPVNDVHFTVLTPGVTILPLPAAPFGWGISSFTGTAVHFITGSNPILPSTALVGYKLCFDIPATAPSVFQVLWQTTLQGRVLCQDTLTLECAGHASRCDTVRVKTLDKCCFDFTAVNQHLPAGVVNDFHIWSMTPGVTIQPSPAAPSGWSVGFANSSEVSYNGSAIAPNTGLGGFVVCFDNIPSSGVFLVRWQTTLDRQPVCTDSFYLQCAPTPSACDSVSILDATGDCCYTVVVKNRHLPAGPLNDAHFTVLTPGYILRATPGAPGGWSVSSYTGASVSFVTTSLLPPGGDQPGFKLCFDPVTGVIGPIQVLWQTTLNGQVICEDTLVFDCRNDVQPCDEVTAALSDTSTCCWRFTVANLHLPVSDINDFHISVLTPGVTITGGSGPATWTAGIGTVTADFATVSAPIPSGNTLGGFTVCFEPKAVHGNPFQVIWQTTLNQGVICSDTLTLQCATTGIEELPGATPLELFLHQNYPNPFNPSTTIQFDLPRDSDVELVVVDAAGRVHINLVHEHLGSGRYQALFDASALPSGQYFYRLRAGDSVQTRAMMLIK